MQDFPVDVVTKKFERPDFREEKFLLSVKGLIFEEIYKDLQ